MEKVTQEDLDQFKWRLGLLRTKLRNNKIAAKLGISPTNLSSFYSGKKTPGNSFLKKFNMLFEQETKDSNYDQDRDSQKNQSPEAREAAPVYQLRGEQDERFRMLRADHEHLQGNFSKIVDSNLKLAAAQDKMSDGHLILIKDQHTLITLLVSKFDNNEIPKREENESVPS